MTNNIKILILIKPYLIRKSLSELLIDEYFHVEVFNKSNDEDAFMSLIERESNCIIITESHYVKKIERYFQDLPNKILIIPVLESNRNKDLFIDYNTITIHDERKVVLDVVQRTINMLPSLNNTITSSRSLSEREKLILQLVAKGFSSKSIAEKLCISVQTVSSHRKNIQKKLCIKTVSGLTLYAVLNNYIKPEETNLS